MTGPFFVDTNVFVYADDRADPSKRDTARELVRNAFRSHHAHLSTQVLAEYFSVATKKLGLSAEAARRRVEIFGALTVFKPTLADLLGAIDLHRLHELSIWDALIVRAAQASGCRLLYTEDLQHGQRFDGLEVINPFK